MRSKSTRLGYCQNVRCLYQSCTKSLKPEISSRYTHWVLSWMPSMAHGLLEALDSREGETRGSTEHYMEMQAEPFPVVCGSLLKPRSQIRSGQRIRAP